MADNADHFDTLEEAIRDMIRECKGLACHIVVNPDDALDEGLIEKTDDRTGVTYYEVDGVPVYPDEDCPQGQIGACVPDEAIGQA